MRATLPVRAMLVGALLIPLSLPAQEYRSPTTVQADSTFVGMTTRNIGPAGTSGRIAAIDAVNSDPDIMYAGAASGGLWKSTDGGVTWHPIMDSVAVNSVGAIAIYQAAPDVVWVGTGEANVRNSSGVGRGVWKSLDGGKTWQFLGLARTEHIENIVLDPTDRNVAYVSALGPEWSDGVQRGVFKTTDGGQTWKKVLFVNDTTGAFSLVMDPSNPQHLLVSTWQFRRWPWFFKSGGPGSGLWVTYDGGDTWRRETDKDGLPKGELGRIGLAFSRSSPNVVYALVEAKPSALLRSDDGGDHWRTVNDKPNVNPRPFYYGRIAVDPTNENRVYRVSQDLEESEDGGRSFKTITPWATVHSDHHAFWTDATGKLLLDGNDGGVFISRNRGSTWRFVENLPVAQFYHISVDMATPFNVYGGLQDNGSWMGPSQVWATTSFSGAKIMNQYWRTIGFGDGFGAVIDPTDPSYGYSQSQEGWLNRFDLKTNEWKTIRPPPPDSSTKLRFNWNAAIAADPLKPGTVFYGSQFVHKTSDRGEHWQIISPDLTTDNPAWQKQAESGGLTIDATGAENFTTIISIAPSPVQEGVIWVGTDDGNVQVTQDGGKTWTNVVDRIKGVPANTWVPHIEPSHFDAGTAYVVFDNHRRGDWGTYVYRTTNYGKSWDRLAQNQVDGYVHTIIEDPVQPNLLFLGGEFGLYVSLDHGKSWRKWTHDFPAGVPVRGLVVHPRDYDLVIATYGRAAWIIDDIRPLRALATDPSVEQQPIHVFPLPPAIEYITGMVGPYYFPGNANFLGGNRPYGALISYWLKTSLGADQKTSSNSNSNSSSKPDSAESAAKVHVRILDGSGAVIREFDGTDKAGVNRVVWDLTRKGYRMPGQQLEEGQQPSGPPVLPGTYTVRVVAGADSAQGTVEVKPDPRREVSLAARRQKDDAINEVGVRLDSLAKAVDRLQSTKESLALISKKIGKWDGSGKAALAAKADSVTQKLDALLNDLRQPSNTVGIRVDSTVSADLGTIYGELTSSLDQPTAGQMEELKWAVDRADRAEARVKAFFADTLPAFHKAIEAAGFSLLGEKE